MCPNLFLNAIVEVAVDGHNLALPCLEVAAGAVQVPVPHQQEDLNCWGAHCEGYSADPHSLCGGNHAAVSRQARGHVGAQHLGESNPAQVSFLSHGRDLLCPLALPEAPFGQLCLALGHLLAFCAYVLDLESQLLCDAV